MSCCRPAWWCCGVTGGERPGSCGPLANSYQARDRPFGGWARVLAPPAGQAGPALAPKTSRTAPQDYPRLPFDLHVNGTAGQEAGGGPAPGAARASRAGWDSLPDDPAFVVPADPAVSPFCIAGLDHDSA